MLCFLKFVTMSTLLLSFLGISMGISHCPMWQEIVPCECRMDSTRLTTILCEKMNSYDQVVNIFKGKFPSTDKVSLRLHNSNLEDLPLRRLKELNMTIENLKLNYDNLQNKTLDPKTFEGLTSVLYLSFADNILGEVPGHIWKTMPNIKTLDLGRTGITILSDSSFENLPHLQGLVLAGNLISQMETNSIPSHVERLHIGRNQISDLNNTLSKLSDLNWLFANTNHLKTLENQLPQNAQKLTMIHVSNNFLEKLPQQLRTIPFLESLFVQHNLISSLEGALSKSRVLRRVVLEHNRIQTLAEDDFLETELLESLLMGHNQIVSLNNSLLNLRNLKFLNITFNLLTEFSFRDIMGLQKLQSLDLSHNKITTITGPAANLLDWNIKLSELKLDHNLIESLNGALSGLPVLLTLDISHNKIKKISPDDLIGLDHLMVLDVSHNYLTTLEETSKTFLPRLSELRASHNYLTILEKDFHGLPVLCHADFTSNHIVALGRDLVSKTRCRIGQDLQEEGTWDTLKINLQDNPIICDSAFPEISSAMSINHTRLYGVAHCPPLSEQPVTSKPNGFLGYIPETTPSVAAIASYQGNAQTTQDFPPIQIKPLPENSEQNLDSNNNLQVYPHNGQENLIKTVEYTVESNEPVPEIKTNIHQPIAVALSVKQNENIDSLTKQSVINVERINAENRMEMNNEDDLVEKPKIESKQGDTENIVKQENLHVIPSSKTEVPAKKSAIDPVKQEQQLTKLASELEELRTKVEELATQNQILINQQQNKTEITPEVTTATTTTTTVKAIAEENRSNDSRRERILQIVDTNLKEESRER